MPYLRYSKDRRGYENTYLVHTERSRGRQQSRVLYWFRTPPGVKVGRAAFDEALQREIERANPGIEFDWPRILKNQPDTPVERDRPERQDRPDRVGERAARRPGREEGRAGSRPDRERDRQPRSERRGDSGHAGRKPTAPAGSSAAHGASEERDPSAAARGELPVDAATAVEDAPSLSRAENANGAAAAEVEVNPATEAAMNGPAFERLGAEGVRRLRGRYQDVAARLSERPIDEQTAELCAQLERLNPDSWNSDDAVVRGLESYESVLEGLRAVVGIRRRRRRRGVRGTAEADAGPAGEPRDASNQEAMQDDAADVEDEAGAGSSAVRTDEPQE